MGVLDPIRASILAVKFIPNVSRDLADNLKLRPDQRSIGLFTCNIDDVGYTALDEATKKAEVEVVYGRSFYAGAAHASGPLSGEFIGILAGPNPAEVKAVEVRRCHGHTRAGQPCKNRALPNREYCRLHQPAT